MKCTLTFFIALVLSLFFYSANVWGQCDSFSVTTGGTTPNCDSYIDIAPYIGTSECETLCYQTASTGVQHGPACSTGNNDIWLSFFVNQATLADATLAISFSSYPGANPPVVAAYLEASGTLNNIPVLGTLNLSISCTSGLGGLASSIITDPWLLDGNPIAVPGTPPVPGAPCFDNGNGDQTFFDSAVLLGTSDVETLLDGAIGAGNSNINAYQIWLQIEAEAAGQVCFEISNYTSGMICGDPNVVPFDPVANPGTETQTLNGQCLCNSALNGSISTTSFAPLANQCSAGPADSHALWYQVSAGYGCNEIEVDIANWSAGGDATVGIISGLNCPDYTTTDLLGNPLPTPGAQVFSFTERASSCLAGGTGTTVTSDPCLPPGDYWVVVSGVTDRSSFDMTITISEPCADVTSLVAGNGAEACSEGSIPLTAITPASVEFVYAPLGQTFTATQAYAAAGTSASLGTAFSNGTQATLGFSLPFPQNSTCSPEQYNIYTIVSPTPADLSCRPMASATVTVYPEIGNSTIVIDNCEITVTARCPDFTVNGVMGGNTISGFLPGQDGQTEAFVVANGLGNCDFTELPVIDCMGDCVPPGGTGTAYCQFGDDANFYVDVDFTYPPPPPPGDPALPSFYEIVDTRGGVLQVTATGTYTLGPYPNNATVQITIENNVDPNCNVTVGTFVSNCLPCPSLTSVTSTLTGPVCEEDMVTLIATTDLGVDGVHYEIQWQLNGVDIPGAMGAMYDHVLETDNVCTAENQEFTAILTCLVVGGAPSAVTEMMAFGSIDVYPIPEFGVAFTQSPDNCVVAPVDNCGGNLNITITPSTDLNPGDANVEVSYNVSLPGAPPWCQGFGSYVVSCPTCNKEAGNGVVSDDVVCWGDSYTITNTGSLVVPPQEDFWSVGWAVTPTGTAYDNSFAPYSDLYAAVWSALGSGDFYGPYDNPGNLGSDGIIPDTLVNDNCQDFPPGQYAFTPFVSMDIGPAGTQVFEMSGSFEVLLGSTFTDPILFTINMDDIIHCAGVTSYNVYFSANMTDGTGGPINNVSGFFNEDYCGLPLLPCGSNVSEQALGYTGDLNGQSITINASSTLGATIAYSVVVELDVGVEFPTVCTSCFDVGQPVRVTLMPDLILPPINNGLNIGPFCADGALDLTAYNPVLQTNCTPLYDMTDGFYRWYEGANTSGNLVANPEEVFPMNGSAYTVEFVSALDANCLSNSVTTQVLLNNRPALDDIADQILCESERPYDLTPLNPPDLLGSNTGNYQWFEDPNGLVPIGDPTTSFPFNTAVFYVVYTNNEGCSDTTGVNFIVNQEPVLEDISSTTICSNETPFNLLTINPSDLNNTAPSTPLDYQWFLDANATTPVADVTAEAVTAGSTYWVVYINGNGCSDTTDVTFSFNAAPLLDAVPNQSLCAGETIDLNTLTYTDLNATTPSNPLDYGFFLNASASNPVPNAVNHQPSNGQTIWVVYTNDAGCTDTTTVDFTVNATPVLTSIAAQSICASANPYDLTTLNPSDLAGTPATLATYTWFTDAAATVSVTNSAATTVADGNEFWVVYINDAGCSDTSSVQFTVNIDPDLATIPSQVLCAEDDATLDLTVFNPSDLAGTPAATATYAWFTDASATSAVSSPTSTTVADGETYYVLYTNDAGCTDMASVDFTIYTSLTGAVIDYDCELDQLVVDVAAMTGGSGMGYAVAASSPNMAGETLANGDFWTVVIEDSFGCSTTINGGVTCCSAGTGDPNSPYYMCCDEAINLQATDVTLGANYVLAWALTDEATGPVTNATEAAAAGALDNVFLSNPDFSYDFTATCVDGIGDLDPGKYYFSPFIAQDPAPAPITYDTLAGCVPDGTLSLTITDDMDNDANTNFALFLVIEFPDGSILDVNNGFLGGAPIDPAIAGFLPPLQLSTIFQGNPNGSFIFTVSNTGNENTYIDIAGFDIIVNCGLTGNIDEVTSIPGQFIAVSPGATEVITLLIPPLVDFPTVNPTCEGYGPASEVYVFDDISYASATATCLDTDLKIYNITVADVQGGAPGIVTGATYVFPASATYDAGTNTYSFEVTDPTFPYDFDIENSINGVSGNSCSITITDLNVTTTCVNCPTGGTPLAMAMDVCNTGTVDLIAAQNAFIATLTNPTNATPAWTLNGVPVTATSNAAVGHNPGDGDCTPSTFLYELTVNCSDPDGAGLSVNGGSVMVTAYPTPPVPTQLMECSLEMVDECAMGNVVIEYSDNGGTSWTATPNPAPEDLETLDWRAYIVGVNPDDAAFANCVVGGTTIAICPLCTAGGGDPNSPYGLCCGQIVDITSVGTNMMPGYVIVWAMTDAATGPVTNEAELMAADALGNVFMSNPDGSLSIENTCTGGVSDFGTGTYYYTPFLSEAPQNPDPVVYDPDNGCNPDGGLDLTITGTDFALFLTIDFPDGSSLDVNGSLLGGGAITPAIAGFLPVLNLSTLYSGDPNGAFTFNITNTGTGDVMIDVAAFDIIVNCGATGNVDQVTPIPAQMVTVLAGGFEVIEFNIPTAVPFPSVNTECTDFGTPVEVAFSCAPVSGTLVKTRAFLEGPYNVALGGMTSILNEDGFIPLSQSYTDYMCAYTGSESVASLNNIPSNATDWVLVELRDADDNMLVLAQKAAFLLSDGNIVDIDGVSNGVLFDMSLANSSYYIVVRHRNHVDIMSRAPIFMPNAVSYDFTTSAAQAFGSNQQQAEVATGVFALYAGDINTDGVITVADFNYYQTEASLINMYLYSDLNLDGNVTVSDFNLYQNNASNLGISQIRCP